MAYNQFTIPRVQADFGLILNTSYDLFASVPSIPASVSLRSHLHEYSGWATMVNTEAARSQFLIAPILGEVWRMSGRRLALYSGTRFDVDVEAGLVGFCDFILGYPPQLDYVVAPVMMIVEAKNEQVMGGLGQCAAEMVAALRFNSEKNPKITTVHGAVTDGTEWRFLRLNGVNLEIDMTDYSPSNPDRILGILLHITGITPAAPIAA